VAQVRKYGGMAYIEGIYERVLDEVKVSKKEGNSGNLIEKMRNIIAVLQNCPS